MEHLPCNVTAILWHLHEALSPTGYHIFSVPILPGFYEETLFPVSEEEKTKRFGQFDHVRRFGSEDLDRSLGMLFSLPKTYDLTQKFSASELDTANIPEPARKGWTGHSVFILRKSDLLLDHRAPEKKAGLLHRLFG
jgi:phosphoglycolate phosphatase